MTLPSPIPVALTIAGSDSGGGAGIQADLRTFAFHKVHGTSAITCVTAQNTLGVSRVDPLPPESVQAQIVAVVEDIGVQAVKTGMLLNAEIMMAVAKQIRVSGLRNLVVDPVMVSRTGAQLIDDAAVKTLCDRLLPLATLITPNRYEAQILSGRDISGRDISGRDIHTLEDMTEAAKEIRQRYGGTVLVKGGGMVGDCCGVDVWWDGDRLEVLKTEWVNTTDTHGTGCTLAAAIAANLALGLTPFDAVQQAKVYVTHALHHALRIGRGQGPVGHFYPLLV
jgi:hydroxymethylpyrimidine/phosphomethylpyrimidine kinase